MVVAGHTNNSRATSSVYEDVALADGRLPNELSQRSRPHAACRNPSRRSRDWRRFRELGARDARDARDR